MKPSVRRPSGFSLVEVIVAMGLALTIGAVVCAVLAGARDVLAETHDAIDLQQRARVGIAVISAAIEEASGQNLPGLLPLRIGSVRSDPEGTFRTDVLTSVTRLGPQSRLMSDMPADSSDLVIETGSGCAAVPPPCGFVRDSQVMVSDDSGAFDLYAVDDVIGPALRVSHLFPSGPRAYTAGATVTAVRVQTYFLGPDARTGVSGLRRYEGGQRGDVPVVDHVVGLRFDYWGERLAPSALLASGREPTYRTTYGPSPPRSTAAGRGYPSGENCVFIRDGVFEPRARLDALGLASSRPGLVRMSAADLTNGPWCPGDTDGYRYDADLFRIRAVDVWLQVEAADDARGLPSSLFRRGGQSLSARRWVRDAEVHMRVNARAIGEVP